MIRFVTSNKVTLLCVAIIIGLSIQLQRASRPQAPGRAGSAGDGARERKDDAAPPNPQARELQQASSALAQKQQEVNELTKELVALRKKNADLEQQILSAQAASAQLFEETEQRHRTALRDAQRNAPAGNGLANPTDQLSAAIREKQAAESAENAAKTALVQTREQLDGIKETLKQQQTESEAKIEALSKELAAKEQQSLSLQDRLTEKEQQSLSLQDRLTEKEQLLKTARDRLSELVDAHKIALNQAQTRAEGEITEALKEQPLIAENQSLRQQVTDLTGQRDQARTTLAQVQKQKERADAALMQEQAAAATTLARTKKDALEQKITTEQHVIHSLSSLKKSFIEHRNTLASQIEKEQKKSKPSASTSSSQEPSLEERSHVVSKLQDFDHQYLAALIQIEQARLPVIRQFLQSLAEQKSSLKQTLSRLPVEDSYEQDRTQLSEQIAKLTTRIERVTTDRDATNTFLQQQTTSR